MILVTSLDVSRDITESICDRKCLSDQPLDTYLSFSKPVQYHRRWILGDDIGYGRRCENRNRQLRKSLAVNVLIVLNDVCFPVFVETDIL
jgi:hypothetical protein